MRDHDVARMKLAVVALVVAVTFFPGARLAVSQQSVLPTDLAALSVPGVTISMLGQSDVLFSPGETITPLLSRLGLTSGTEPATAIVVAPEIWVVDAGSLTVFDPQSGQVTYEAGSQVAVDRPDIYPYRITGEACASVLRFQTAIGAGMEISSSESGPALGPGGGNDCAESGNLNTSWLSQPYPGSPATLFIARAELTPFASFPDSTFSGPVVLSVEAGELAVTLSATFPLRLGAGSSVVLPTDQQLSLTTQGEEGARLLISGVLPVEATADESEAAPKYASPSYGYTLTWPESWTTTSQSSEAGIDRLQLSNGTSNIFVQGFPTDLTDAFACLESGIAGYNESSGYSQVGVVEAPSGDAVHATGLYSAVWSGGTTPASFAVLLVCEMLPDGAAVFLSFTTGLTDFESEAVVAAPVIESLTTADEPG